VEDLKLWIDGISSVGIVGAFAAGVYQAHRLAEDARERDRERRIERALDLYRDLVVESDTATAFHQFSVALRAEGFRRFHISTWYLPLDGDLDHDGFLDPTVPGMETSFQNLYKVLWFFERAHNALEFRLVDADVTFNTIGYHCWWWGQVLLMIREPKASVALHRLAARAEAWARENHHYDDWVARCTHDFGGAGPRVL